MDEKRDIKHRDFCYYLSPVVAGGFFQTWSFSRPGSPAHSATLVSCSRPYQEEGGHSLECVFSSIHIHVSLLFRDY
jgi:hypothetical protein